MEKVFK